MKNTRKACAVATAALGLSFGLSACGDDAPAAKDAWNKTQDRVGTYKTVKISANGTTDGKKISAKVFGEVNGKSNQMDIAQDGAKASLLTVNGKQYMKADKAYYNSLSKGSAGSSGASSMYSKLADKWIETGKASGDSFFTDMKKDIQDDSNATVKKFLSDKATVTEDKVDGKDAWKITSEDKKATAWVSKDDNYDLLKLSGAEFNSKQTGSDKSKLDEVKFSDYNKDFNIKAPSDAKSMTELLMGK